MGKYLIIIGIVMVVLGLIWHFFGESLSWIGNLPGDIRIENERSKIFIPITTMIILSIIISLAMYVIRRFF